MIFLLIAKKFVQSIEKCVFTHHTIQMFKLCARQLYSHSDNIISKLSLKTIDNKCWITYLDRLIGAKLIDTDCRKNIGLPFYTNDTMFRSDPAKIRTVQVLDSQNDQVIGTGKVNIIIIQDKTIGISFTKIHIIDYSLIHV